MFKKVYSQLELLFFFTAILALYFINPAHQHSSLCPLASLGFTFCPGCGLGRSLHYLMHGHFQLSWQMHPLGFFAFVVIIFRIYTLTKKSKVFEP